MAKLSDILEYCNHRIKIDQIADFPGACNGLQFEGKSEINKIGAAVDAGLVPFQKAIHANIDFLIVHHGMFWSPPFPVMKNNKEKLKLLFNSEMSVYGAHLPLDAHEDIGNNAIIRKKLNLKQMGRFLPYEGTDIGIIAEGLERHELNQRLKKLFPNSFCGLEFGSSTPAKIAISSGSGNHPFDEIQKLGIDTLITGELKQHHYNLAQEAKLNIYPCGHYATEVFGVEALGEELSKQFNLEFEFISMECPF